MKRPFFLLSLLLILSCSKDNQTDSLAEINCNPEPILKTNQASDITDTSTVISGNITPATCTASITSQGFVYGTNNLPTISNSKVVLSGTSISTSLTNLEQNTTYYFRTFFENPAGVFYGNESSFTTSVGDITFLNSNYSNVTTFSVVISFGVNESGGGTISEQGIVYSLNSNPTINDTKIELSGSSINIEGLQPDTLYYFRPFGVNESGLFYGEEIEVKTAPENISSEINRVELQIGDPFQNSYSKGYCNNGIDADVFINTNLEYIKDARIEILEFYIDSNTNEQTFQNFGGWIIKNDSFDYSQSYFQKTEISPEGTLLKEIGKGGTPELSEYDLFISRCLYIINDFRLRVKIEDFSGNFHYSDYFQLNLPDF